MMSKAAGLECDFVFLDLEDAVAPEAKAEARGQVIEALNRLDWQARSLAVRINDVTSEHCHDDIIDLVTGAGDKLSTLILTKTRGVNDLSFVHLLLDQLEQKQRLKKRIGIECLIEDVEGMLHIEEIAAASDRLESLVLGMGDYSASQQMKLSQVGQAAEGTDIWHYPRYRLTVACRANGLDPVDGPYANFRDPEGLAAECHQGSLLGMAGKWAIHPGQVEAIQAAYSPEQQAVDEARRQKAAYDQAVAEGLGAISFDGVMLDAASAKLLQNIIDQADMIGM